MNGKKKKKRVEAWNRDREDNDEWLIYTKTRSRVFRYCLHRRRGRGERCTVQIIFEEERKKKKKKRKKRILKSTNHCPIRCTIEMVIISHEYESTRSSSFLRKKKKKKTRVDERFDLDDEECEKEVIYCSSRAEFLVAC